VTKNPSDAEEELGGDLAPREKVDPRGTLSFYARGAGSSRAAPTARVSPPSTRGSSVPRYPHRAAAADRRRRWPARTRGEPARPPRDVHGWRMRSAWFSREAECRAISAQSRVAPKITQLTPPVARTAFEASVLPHLDAAYKPRALALTGMKMTRKTWYKDAYLKAFRFYDGFSGRQQP